VISLLDFRLDLVGSMAGSFLLLNILREQFLVAFLCLLAFSPTLNSLGLDKLFAAETLLRDHALDAG